MNTKQLAWLSRHPPTKAQKKQLEAAGYSICVKHPPDRYHSNSDMWALAQLACGGLPSVIMAIAPKGMLGRLISRANDYGVPIVQPVNVLKDGAFEWTGKWKRMITVSEEWTPEKEGGMSK